MILTVVGNVDPVHVSDLANRMLPQEGGPVIRRITAREPETVAERRPSWRWRSPRPQFLTGLQVRPGGGRGGYRAAILGDMACDILLGSPAPVPAAL